jgi:uncharacterized protein (TIGR02284 family)
MENQNELTGVLNDLIRINNDRIEGYQRASQESKDTDVDLKAIFHEMADQSMKYVNELTEQVAKMGGDPASNTTISGKVYRVWMDLRAAVTGSSRTNILDSCEFGEDVAQKAYQAALESDAAMTTDVRQIIAEQKSALKVSHDAIKKYRDMHQSVKS